MKKDIQTLEKITKLLREAFQNLYNIENVEDVFNSPQALEVIKKYPSINASLDDLLYPLFAYFEELTFTHKKIKK